MRSKSHLVLSSPVWSWFSFHRPRSHSTSHHVWLWLWVGCLHPIRKGPVPILAPFPVVSFVPFLPLCSIFSFPFWGATGLLPISLFPMGLYIHVLRKTFANTFVSVRRSCVSVEEGQPASSWRVLVGLVCFFFLLFLPFLSPSVGWSVPHFTIFCFGLTLSLPSYGSLWTAGVCHIL